MTFIRPLLCPYVFIHLCHFLYLFSYPKYVNMSLPSPQSRIVVKDCVLRVIVNISVELIIIVILSSPIHHVDDKVLGSAHHATLGRSSLHRLEVSVICSQVAQERVMTLARSACTVELRVRLHAAGRATVIILILGLATDPVATVLAL